MSRQVRLDDDVAAWVAGRQGDGSLSAAANMLLRELRERDELQRVAFPPVLVGGTGGNADVALAPMTVANSGGHRAARAAHQQVLGRKRPTLAPVAAMSPTSVEVDGCAHPLLRRRDGLCGACGVAL